jgi:hypothetical protein
VFINEQHDAQLETHPILRVADSTAFAPNRKPEFAQVLTPQHWGVVEALVRDPDGRNVSLQAPLPQGVASRDADSHHQQEYGSNEAGGV